jgi:uncharacterized damage-inducible protein DinB
MDPRIAPLADLLRLNTRLLRNCIDGLSDAQASARPVPEANSVAFLVAHLTDARHTLLALLGGSAENPLASYLADARGIDDVRHLPPLAELVLAWQHVAAELDAHLAGVSSGRLDAPAAQRFPVEDGSVLGALAFLVQHDSYHVGQLALLRRAHGLPAMRYGSTRPAAT